MVVAFDLRAKPFGSVTAIYANAPTASPLTFRVVSEKAVRSRWPCRHPSGQVPRRPPFFAVVGGFCG